MERTSSEPDLNAEKKKRTLGDTSFENEEGMSNKQERLTSPPAVSLVARSSLWEDSPPWAMLLHKEISELKTSMTQLMTMKEDIKKEVKQDIVELKNDLSGKVQKIEQSAQFVSDKYDEVRAEATSALNLAKNLQEENLKLREEVESLKWAADEAEQYSRRDCLLFRGIPEVEGENTDQIVVDIAEKWLDVKLKVENIYRSHRVKVRKQRSTPRPIIVRFIDYHHRDDIYRGKHKLKGTKISIVESLTPRRLELYELAKETFGMKNVWTLDGKIYTNKGVDADGKRVLIKTEADIYKV